MRPDLAALTIEVVTALSNLGLVKRSLREIEQGKGPVLSEATDGTVVGAFPEGVTVSWPPGIGLRDASCSCGAREACRHRVAVALGYKAWSGGARASSEGPAPASATQPATTEPPSPAASDQVPATDDSHVANVEPVATASPPRAPLWSPAELDDQALRQFLGARVFDTAKTLRARGVLARVRPGSSADAIPTVALPACTVRFLAPRALAFARCDCRMGERCAHIALAVWAFRALPAGAPATEYSVEVRQTSADAIDPTRLAPVRELAAWVLRRGIADVASSSEVYAQRAAEVAHGLRELGYVWLLTLLDELSAAVVAYKSRNAGYRAAALAEVLTGIEARSRAALAGTGELPTAFVLGRDTPFETRLDQVRLTSLGARLRARGTSTDVRVLLTNLDTGDVLALDRNYEAEPGGKLPQSSELSLRRLASTTLQALAGGHIVTQAAVRRANDELLIRNQQRGTSSVMPQNGDFSMLSSSRRFHTAAALTEHLRLRPPALLRPRRLGEETFVIEVAGVEHVGFDAAEQTLFASLVDREGQGMWLVRRYDAAAPRALEAIAAALTGTWGPVRWVAGEVELGVSGLVLDPSILTTDRVVVPDLELNAPAFAVPRARALHRAPVWRKTMDDVMERLVEAAQLGLDQLAGTYATRLARSIEASRAAGFTQVPARLQALLESLGGSGAGVRAGRWFDAMLRSRLVLDQA